MYKWCLLWTNGRWLKRRKTIKELQRLHIQIDNRSFVDGKAWWNHVLQTKAITVEQSQQFLLVDAPPAR